MKVNAIMIVGILFALLAVAVFAVVAAQSPFPAFKYATQTAHYVSVTQNATQVGPLDSQFMWNNNSLNLIAQAFVLFAAAAGTLALLNTNKSKESE